MTVQVVISSHVQVISSVYGMLVDPLRSPLTKSILTINYKCMLRNSVLCFEVYKSLFYSRFLIFTLKKLTELYVTFINVTPN